MVYKRQSHSNQSSIVRLPHGKNTRNLQKKNKNEIGTSISENTTAATGTSMILLNFLRRKD